MFKLWNRQISLIQEVTNYLFLNHYLYLIINLFIIEIINYFPKDNL